MPNDPTDGNVVNSTEAVIAINPQLLNKVEVSSESSNLIPLTIQVENVWDVADQTVYLTKDDLHQNLTGSNSGQVLIALNEDFFFEGEIILTDGICQCAGRALICLCAKGEWISITLRRKGKLSLCTQFQESKEEEAKKISRIEIFEREKAKRKINHADYGLTGYSEGSFDSKFFFNPIADMNEAIYEILLEKRKYPQGLLVISGSTGTGKSQVVRGLIDRYLRDTVKKQSEDKTKSVPRRLHLVTYEDPIEEWAFAIGIVKDKREVYDPESAARYGIDYTPRLKGTDVKVLMEAFSHAKRQTPALFYIGEVRNNDEWKDIVTFAGEGNFVVATTHANSVVETISKIFQSMNIDTPAERGQIANRFIGVIHLRPHKFRLESSSLLAEPFERAITIPALWNNTPQGVQSLVSDGLGSVLPYCPTSKHLDKYSSIGRRYFSEKLLGNLKVNHFVSDPDIWNRTDENGKDLATLIADALIKDAIRFDLEEM